ncbi:pentatricopeptide repeat-containing protein At3g61360 [Cajanus cajan]|uniref:pentatricopeptide repeat-containing protein At3g61360 n=1 Tax=Cajanus cajan TaxID=3821 RepID=UPI00098DB0D2|nr:pentatricopeptide repeat-containing protein At3g61360 [Cajanus cajan]XP_020217021.1 pentatricopeptide repeat-containing protein At3g61360 [Cajanus cajan]XP_020217022.1 pentatricopeptide repeat-containing protein At3g61360 [Cajanus cajan]XP_020217023.1 pentatricopeptide repeat-containing protein At3g61360 [Cajanus cajan]XP_020217024.1 pentatricopeptide repeat-containing protein At3g61360 [Cajanus cajan]XP_029127466.1 pentatricopeptide repeat-containing protein At3g61360 [Cajanus cajan]XP_02
MASKSMRQSNYLWWLCNFNFNPNITYQRFSHLNNTIDSRQYLPDLIRSFSIIAHVHHGKSTLADGLLEPSRTITKSPGQPQHLDKLQVERESEITVKAQAKTMLYMHSINSDDCSGGKESPTSSPNVIGTPESCSLITIDVETLTRTINEHPFPLQPLHPTLLHLLPPCTFSTSLVENILGRLFASHCNGLKALEFFNYSLIHSHSPLSPASLNMTLHILTRMRYFDKAWALLRDISITHPSLLTHKSMNIMLSKIAKFQSFEDTLDGFKRMENEVFVGMEFGTEEFNVLLKACCTQRQMKEAKSMFAKLVPRFSPNTKSMNILLLGFKESGDVTSVELFYHEMVKRGFNPDGVTFNIRIDAYCKKGCFGDALRLLEEMERRNVVPTIKTITTLIHGAGLVRNIGKAWQLFNEIPLRNLVADTGAHNALITALVRNKDIESALSLIDNMVEKCIELDSVTYHTMFLGLMRSRGIEGVSELYQKMTQRNFVPKARTIVMLMKYFCQNYRLDLGVCLWNYLVEKGYCPHSHALDLLVTGLCARGLVHDAFECSKQMLERGRHMSSASFLMLERFLLQTGDLDKLKELDQMIKKLQSVLPPSRGHATGISTSGL